jgi:hypothetical protein
MRSNVALRSNIYIGTLKELLSDPNLMVHVRGRNGLTKLLQRLAPGRSIRDAAALHLTPEQIAQLYQDPCSECGFFTVGPVMSPEGPILAVRCPRGTCASSVLPTRELLVDQQMWADIALLATRTPGLDLSGLVVRALGNGHSAGGCALEACHRAAVRLPAPLYYRFYTHSDRQFAERVKHCLAEARRND